MYCKLRAVSALDKHRVVSAMERELNCNGNRSQGMLGYYNDNRKMKGQLNVVWGRGSSVAF